MGDYHLSGLNPREFEHLIQALAQKVIAPGIRPFGDGKDGGREATYEGRMGYPSAIQPWDGYLVIQAKFLQRPFQHAEEGAWALGQLEKELKKFSGLGTGLRKPEYYIFATNAVFTPVHEAGTIDRADALFDSYRETIGFRGYEVWHHDKVCRLLDAQQDIRRRYSAFITAGDILAQVMASLEGGRPDFEPVMSNYLQKQLQADQYVRLGQAGYASEERTPLAQVFVDLPACDDRSAEPPNESAAPTGKSPGGFVGEVLREAAQLLDPRTLWGREVERRPSHLSSGEDIPEDVPEKEPMPGRYVLVGGPGQGKTTIGQYICQLHRVAILVDRPPHSLSPEARRALDATRAGCELDGLALPGARRYPIRIDLSQFARQLAGRSVRSLLTYILSDINTITCRDLSADDLRAWLGAYPWILILDGLDEVPASSNRGELLDRINDFWSDVSECNADVMVVATTRPQGYEKEFSPDVFRHRHLAPLSTRRALHYARRLVEARYPDAHEVNRRILDGLERACREEAIARLMRTPLQITIMAFLVYRVGDPPSQRWPLFQKYFEVVYDRELAKGGTTSTILREQRKHVEAVHQRVGLRLQLDGERAGGTDASLSIEEFEKLVRDRLSEVGHAGETLRGLVERIGEATMQRLVLLVSPTEGRVGFEIRSLQEFMAAEALMSGEDAQVRTRLESIASVPYWRNVFLFAAGNWIARREHAFDSPLAICDSLNEAPPFRTAILEGSRLALDLMEDGLAREFPNHSRSLARKALRLLRLPPDDWLDRLSALISPETEDVYFEEITDGLNQADVFAQLSAWDLLFRHAASGSRRAEDLIHTRWPSDPPGELEILRAMSRHKVADIPHDRIVGVVPRVTYHQLVEAEVIPPLRKQETGDLPGWFTALSLLLDRSRRDPDWFREIPIRFVREGSARLRLMPIGHGPHRILAELATMPAGHIAWSPIVASARFIADPSPRTLCEALRASAAIWDNKSYVVSIPSGNLPWPLAECIASVRCADDFLRMADRAEAGELGDLPDWQAAEESWAVSGLDGEVLAATSDEHYPFDLSVLQVGLPFRCSNVTISHDSSNPLALESLVGLHERLPATRGRRELADLILDTLGDRHFARCHASLPSVHRLKGLVRDSRRKRLDITMFRGLQPEDVRSEEWADLFDLIGRDCRLCGFRVVGSKLPEGISALRVLYPDRPGLVNFLGALALLGYPIPPLSNIPDPRDIPDGASSALALLIHLCLPNLGERVEHLARCARDLVIQDSYLINMICTLVIERRKGDEAAARFLAALLPDWPKERWLSKGRAVAFIIGTLHSRRSALAEPAFSRDL